MRRFSRLLSPLLIVAVVMATALPSSAATPIGTAFTYEGQLSFNGAAVTGDCDFQAGLWDAATAGAQIGSTQAVSGAAVANGLFAITLDFGPGAFDGSARWLAVSVRCPAGSGAYTALDPRQPLNPTPYALRAGAAAQADSAPWTGISGVPAGFADGTDADTTYSAGTGLALAGTTFSADTTALQARVSESCTTGQKITAIAADGSVTCAADIDTDTTYTAGSGLWLTDTTFSADTDVVQARVTGSCTAAQKVLAMAADGTVTCGTDVDTDTTYTAGAGLWLTGTTFSANTAALQARVSGACAVGQYVRAVAADGSVTCGTDADTNTTYAAGDGLALAGTTFSADATLARVSAITPTVEAAGFITRTLADGTYQARVTGTCAVGQYVSAVAADGTVTCGTDADTTYTAGSGLTLTGGAFSVQFAGSGAAATAARSDHTHDAGVLITGTLDEARIPASIARQANITNTVEAAGFITSTLANTRYTYTAGAGLALAGNQFGVVTSTIQARVTGTCAVGQYVRAVAADGSVTCGTDVDTDTNTTYTAGTGLNLSSTTFNVVTTTIQGRVTGACAAGSSIRTVNADGSVVCEADDDTNTTYSAGTGLTLSGTQFSINTATTQARITGTCTAGQKITAIAADGSVTCGTDIDTDTDYRANWGSISGIPAGFSDGVDDYNTGDITGVTAGTGLTGGGASGDVSLSVNPAGVAGTMVLLASAVNLWTNGSTAAGGAVHSVSVGAYNYPAVLLRVRAWFPDAAGTGAVSFGTWGALRNHLANIAHEQTFWAGTSGGAVAMTVAGGSTVNIIVDIVGYLR